MTGDRVTRRHDEGKEAGKIEISASPCLPVTPSPRLFICGTDLIATRLLLQGRQELKSNAHKCLIQKDNGNCNLRHWVWVFGRVHVIGNGAGQVAPKQRRC